MSVGFDPARFWVLTMREVDREMRGASRRLERENNERMSLAWHIVALDRSKKLPKIETLMRNSGKPRKPQTEEEKLFAMKSIFLAFGGDPAELRTEQ